MLKRLLKTKPVIEPDVKQWLIDTFSWCVENFDTEMFENESQLILPNNSFYPGRVSSIEEMANNVYQHTLTYAGMNHWPLIFVAPQHFQQIQQNNTPTLPFIVRGKNKPFVLTEAYNNKLSITFNPAQVNQPQDLIATIVQQFATILIQSRKALPPGGQQALPQAVDVLAVVMGFGIIFSNTAYQFRGGCGSCFNAAANREAALPENEIVYCLAIYAYKKSIEPKLVLPHLKSHLRGYFKKAVKDLKHTFT